MLQNFEARALRPAPIGIGTAISFEHCVIQHAPRDRLASLQQREDQARSSTVGAIRRVEKIGHGGSPA